MFYIHFKIVLSCLYCCLYCVTHFDFNIKSNTIINLNFKIHGKLKHQNIFNSIFTVRINLEQIYCYQR